MNIVNFLLASILIGILIFISTQNFLFNFSFQAKKQEFYNKADNFVKILERIANLDVETFYHEYFFGLANLTVKNNILKISSGNDEISYYLDFKVEESTIINKGRICVIKSKDAISIKACDEITSKEDGNCEISECRIDSIDCKGPKRICINDGYCNTFIGENCKNSNDCSCQAKGDDYVCCPENPNSDKDGCLKLTNKKNEGEECYCDNECSYNLKCNPVDPNFKDYKSNKACCPEGKSWNGSYCVENKPKLTLLFIPVNWKGNLNFKEVAEKHFNFFLENYPIKSCPEKVRGIFEDRINCNVNFVCDCHDLEKIYDCAKKTGYMFDFVIGITDQDFCGNIAGFSCNIETVYVEGYNTLVTAHELGHEFGLNDEYIDACRCGFGLINKNANCLKSDIGGSDAFPPYTSDYCGEKGSKCPAEYTITCYGNKNDLGGRDIMSFENAPGPRAFARESWNWLIKIPQLQC